MKLSEAQRKKMIDYIQEKWVLPTKCPVCKQNDWNVSSEVYEIREFHGGGMVIGGKSVIAPLVPVTCYNCGNTLLFNALIAKLDIKEGKT
jgi:predicted nucleic-acid-binding Zn-ribbon protein